MKYGLIFLLSAITLAPIKSLAVAYGLSECRTAVIRPTGAREETRFDALGRRTRFMNAEGKAVSFGFDALGRLISVTNAIGKVTRYGFDPAGNLAWRVNAADELTEYDYDAMNRLVSVTHESVEVSTYDHDSNGNLTLSENANGSIAFDYNEQNLLTSTTQLCASVSSVVENCYDLNGNRTNVVYPGGLSVSYNYGADNRLLGTSISAPSAPLREFSFGYDTANRLTGIAYPNGVNSAFGYDAESRVTNIVHGSFTDRKIQRNALGFKTLELINAGIKPEPLNMQRRIATHNDADQLVGERIQSNVTNWTDVTYSYNDNGGLETVGSAASPTAYTYDYDNRLVLTTEGTESTEYIYDAAGVRIGRTHNGVTAYYIVDYADALKRPLAETDVQGNITRYYVWSGSHLLCHVEANGIVRYYHADELGSTLAMTDETGAVTDQFAYMPYGYATHTAGPNSQFSILHSQFLWLGGYGVCYDTDTKLHLTLHRAYSCELKRFITPDPLGIDGGVNVYMMANINPLFFIDPYGLSGLESSSLAWMYTEAVVDGFFDADAWSAGMAVTANTMTFGLACDESAEVAKAEYYDSTMGQIALGAGQAGRDIVYTAAGGALVGAAGKASGAASWLSTTANTYQKTALALKATGVGLGAAGTGYLAYESYGAFEEGDYERGTHMAGDALMGAVYTYEGGKSLLQSFNAPNNTRPLDWSRTSPRTGGDAAHHVKVNHGNMNLGKPQQGVFYGNDPVGVVDDAWAAAQRQGIKPVTVGNRDIYTLPRPNSGYAGGMGGQLQNLDNITLITEQGTTRTVTAFPGNPPLPKNYVPFTGGQ